ncbi:tetratricopeptide repeat protein [Streptomyces sp. NPDC049954]|uniref:tetratricopeptide repeat protein n=1 Tax=Streptomyces sp. NPDC049954 TaxID=3155779 RepID=UPI00341294F0
MSTSARRSAPRRRPLLSAAVATVLGVGLFAAGGIGLAPWSASHGDDGAASSSEAAGAPPAADPAAAGGVTALQRRLRANPRDSLALGSLGLAYVQQARTSGDPTYYPKAETALKKSLALEKKDNYTALGGMAALEAARHHFTRALDWARRATAVNPYNATLQGTLADAYTQLGRYAEAADATQRMVDLKPGTPSFARASYAAELRGDTTAARADMRRALKAAAGPEDRAFARYYLSELAFNSGDAATALTEAEAGLRAAPSYTALLQAKARAEAALGHDRAALTDLRRAVERLPLPEYVLQLGELHASLGHREEAGRQYEVFRAEQRVFAANGVTLDSDAALYEADHGTPARAVRIARQGLASRPFLDSHDALAWALHAAGRDREALAEADLALSLGTRNALFHYHRALIHRSLGHRAEARADLDRALAINPHFHPLHAAEARKALTALR